MILNEVPMPSQLAENQIPGDAGLGLNRPDNDQLECPDDLHVQRTHRIEHLGAPAVRRWHCDRDQNEYLTAVCKSLPRLGMGKAAVFHTGSTAAYPNCPQALTRELLKPAKEKIQNGNFPKRTVRWMHRFAGCTGSLGTPVRWVHRFAA